MNKFQRTGAKNKDFVLLDSFACVKNKVLIIQTVYGGLLI